MHDFLLIKLSRTFLQPISQGEKGGNFDLYKNSANPSRSNIVFSSSSN